ncbi:MAG: hypothetical protein LV479_10890 [Methylacidiphilales bacterium]|nr:hypothetical protein [Candidatus Methylacidiphilales bacterium]
MTTSRRIVSSGAITAISCLTLFLTACNQQSPPAASDQAPPPQQQASSGPAFSTGFEGITQLPSDWTTEGNVSIDATSPAFKGTGSLLLSRAQLDAEKPCSATSPAFPTQPGIWEIDGGCRPDLYSPDSSYDAKVILQCLDASGKVINEITISDVFGKNGWNSFGGQFEIPQGTVSSRFHILLDKTYGQYWVDALSATYLQPAPHHHIDRLVFSTVALGNLLYPTDSRIVTLTTKGPDELAPEEQVVHFVIRDYWGAEQIKPVDVSLKVAPKEGDNFVYEGSVDLAGMPLEAGKYYELNGEIPQKDAKPFRNNSALAIVPEAINNSFKPDDIPFTSRNWDGRMPMGFELSHRMGIRIMNIWSGWNPEPPYEPHAPCVELCQKYGMGALFGTESYAIESHGENWQKYDEKALQEGTKNLINTYGRLVHPCILDLGNEPPVRADRIDDDIKAYKAIYETAKEMDPNIKVLGTSVGPSEDFFKAGMGKYCDYYDFHVYESPQDVAQVLQRYQELFKKYGHPHPIWSTEIGLNSEGMARHPVAVDMVKKFAIFFAYGGSNMSWFDLFYPDPDAKIAGSNGESFNVFDSRYEKYNPKLTAITLFDMLNLISVKKFVEQKQYGTDARAFLFRDKNQHDLQVLWKDGDRQDAFVPLPGVKQVEIVRLDGTHRSLDAEGKGVTLTLDADPLVLLYDGKAALASKLGDAAASVNSVSSGIVRGGTAQIEIQTQWPDFISLNPPPFWKVQKTTRPGLALFTLSVPEQTEVREADILVDINNSQGARIGELYLRPRVAAQLSSALEPAPAGSDGNPSVQLLLKNNGAARQDVSWAVSLLDEMPLVGGEYHSHIPVKAQLGAASKGQLSLDPGASQTISLPLTGTDRLTPYHLRTEVTDSQGTVVTHERYVGGFIAVPKVKGPINFDGVLDEDDWKNAPVEKFDEERQYYAFEGSGVKWGGPADLSGTLRFLWDDQYLYVGVEVTDDKIGGAQEGNMLWAQDGLQFLIDPCRGKDESVGKYDYTVGIGKKGLQAWCSLTADAGSAPSGDVMDMKLSAKRKGDGTGAVTYEIAFPWSRLAPFKPEPNGNLGLSIILNEDDGQGRKSFMTWFGNPSSKETDPVGDLILQP